MRKLTEDLSDVTELQPNRFLSDIICLGGIHLLNYVCISMYIYNFIIIHVFLIPCMFNLLFFKHFPEEDKKFIYRKFVKLFSLLFSLRNFIKTQTYIMCIYLGYFCACADFSPWDTLPSKKISGWIRFYLQQTVLRQEVPRRKILEPSKSMPVHI